MGWTMPWYSVPQDSVDPLIADPHFGILVSYLRDGDQVFETYWTTGRGNEATAPSHALLDMTAYGRQATWEYSPEGWPQRRRHRTATPYAMGRRTPPRSSPD